MFRHAFSAALLAGLLTSCTTFAAEPLVVKLWPGKTPGDVGIKGEEYLALKRAGIPVELHIYASGNHDFGVRQNDKLPASWTLLCVKWLQSQELYRASPRN